MSRLKKDFAAASGEQRLKYCVNVIEEAAMEGKSRNRIMSVLENLGAPQDMIDRAFELAEELGLPTERENALTEANRIISETDKPFSNALVRRIINKLAYRGFEPEIIDEIVEKLLYEYDIEDFYS
ncbi:MAG: RecX family transcriptional regulator [Bacillota bacterium]|nr:RecX family transcriptional regulator [Bacillota bacterium]